MFGTENNSTTELMLPILLDMANLVRRAVRPGKESREVKIPLALPQTQFMKRSFIEDTSQSDEYDPGVVDFKPVQPTTTKAPKAIKSRNTRAKPQRNLTITNNPHKTLTTDTGSYIIDDDNKTEPDNLVNTRIKENSNLTSSHKADDYNVSHTSLLKSDFQTI